jgi:type I restriction enzyme M protein
VLELNEPLDKTVAITPFRDKWYNICCIQAKLALPFGGDSGSVKDITVYGQESNQTTWKLSKMNLAIRNINSKFVAWNTEGSFLKDAHPDLKADFILANPPFNQKEWGVDILQEDARWKYGTPPNGNANFAWMQHMLYHLSLKGVMATVLSNGSLSSNTSGEGDIRKNLVEADLVECIVAFPKQLFYNTGIPACVWFLRREKNSHSKDVLFIDPPFFPSALANSPKKYS